MTEIIVHQTHLAGYAEDGDEVWACLLCSYQAQYGKYGFIVVNLGDPQARHYGPGTRLEAEPYPAP